MRVSIAQPAYLPWIGYIERVIHSDVHIILDHVKIDWHSKTQFTNRNRVLTANGPAWLTVPLIKKHSTEMLINTIQVNDREQWRRKHWMTMRQSYAKTSFFPQHQNFFELYYSHPADSLLDVLGKSSDYILAQFGCTTKKVKSSRMEISGQKNELVLNICKACNADTYLSGPFGREYLDLQAFRRAGIKVLFHDFTPFVYPQTRHGFVPFLSAVDLLFNVGSDKAQEILHSNITLREH